MIHQSDKDTRLCQQLQALCEEIDDVVSLFANTSAFLNEVLEDINWVGFYIVKNDALQLSAFQGKPACVKIAKGKGVCGAPMPNAKYKGLPMCMLSKDISPATAPAILKSSCRSSSMTKYLRYWTSILQNTTVFKQKMKTFCVHAS